MKGVLEQIRDNNCECIDILCDNSSPVKLSRNHVMHRNTKHIDVRYYYLCDLSNQGVIKLILCGTREQIAKIMTKSLKVD